MTTRPRAYFKEIKRASAEGGKGPQIVKISTDESTPPEECDFDPKEPMLCHKCEQDLQTLYEAYGTQFFKPKSPTTKGLKSVFAENLDYERLFLYLSSILWRVSISRIPEYRHVQLSTAFAEKLRHHIRAGMVGYDGTRLDALMKIAIYKLHDPQNQLSQGALNQSLFIHLNAH